ncbi:hypothetical protein EDC01DRAFT_670556 [Geopyxis carbonaria]|nr:hypothetical protein EDC01DRAFT_670556 [Geopyxis carbonaria]
MAPPPAPLSEFFARYPSFKHDPRFSVTQEFTRLAYEKGWAEDGDDWNKHYRKFLDELENIAASSVHTFFIRGFPEFIKYNATGAPKEEFSRLATQMGWKKGSPQWSTQYNELMEAYFTDFRGAMNDFFMSYEDEEQQELENPVCIGWVHNPWNSPPAEWRRLADARGWGKNSTEWRVGRIAFHTAVEEDFDDTFGKSEHDSEGWEFLCGVLGVKIPDRLNMDGKRAAAEVFSTECKKELAKAYVNIYDVLDSVRACGHVQFFKTEKDLSDYSYEYGKVFPLHIAQSNGALMFMLRSIAKWRDGKKPTGRKKKNKADAPVQTAEGTIGLELADREGAMDTLAEHVQSLKVSGGD